MRFSAPTTINDTVPRYFATGRVEPRPSVPTAANAMDVGNPSNLERLQWFFDGDLTAMRQVITTAAHTDDGRARRDRRAATRSTLTSPIRTPRSAILARSRHAVAPGTALFLSTAHPAKFREVVEPVIGKPVPLPDALAETLARKKVVQRIGPTLGELSKLL